MGKEILYCNKCGKQLSGDDFTRGRAHTFDNKQFCSSCLPSTHTPKPTPAPSSSSRIPKRQASSMHLPVQGAAPAGPTGPAVYVSLAVAAGVIVLLLVLFLNPSAPPPPPPPEPAGPRVVEPKKPADDPARKAIEQAREFSSGNPHAVDERVRRWEQAVAACARTPHAEEASKGLERAIADRKEEFAQEIKALEPKIAERLKLEQFGAAADVLEEAKKRHESPEWLAAVGLRIRDVQDAANKLYPDLKTKAVAAQTTGDSARVGELRNRLLGWGRRDLLEDLESELPKIIPREPVPPGATVLLRFPKDGTGSVYKPYGPIKNGALLAPPYAEKAVMSGFESIREQLTIPTEGEIWLTYATNSPKTIWVRYRVIRGDKTAPYNWVIEKPEVGRPVRVKVPMMKFKDYGNKLVNVGDRVSTIYIQQDDPKAELMIYEAVIFRIKE